MVSFWVTALLLAFVLPAEGPVKKKQFRKALREFRSCASSAHPVPGGPTLSGGSQYAELMRLEMRGLDKRRWRAGANERSFQLEKKAAFGQRFRFELTIGTEQIEWIRIRVGDRGDRSAYGAVWRGSRLFVFPMDEQCTERGCSWVRISTLEMTCGAAAIPAK